MCGRYTGNEEESEVISKIYREVRQKYPISGVKSGDIYPADRAPILLGKEATPFPAIWGFPWPGKRESIINARAESVREKPMFADGFRYRRCVIPTTGYYEWNRAKQKFYFRLPDRAEVYLGGIFRQYPDGMRFTILTTEPSRTAKAVHNRMPLLLDDIEAWLTQDDYAERLLQTPMPEVACVMA